MGMGQGIRKQKPEREYGMGIRKVGSGSVMGLEVEYGNGTGKIKMKMRDMQRDQEYNGNKTGNMGLRKWECNQTENMGQGMRLGTGSGQGWEQNRTWSVVTQQWAGGKGSDSGEKGFLDRGHQDLG